MTRRRLALCAAAALMLGCGCKDRWQEGFDAGFKGGRLAGLGDARDGFMNAVLALPDSERSVGVDSIIHTWMPKTEPDSTKAECDSAACCDTPPVVYVRPGELEPWGPDEEIQRTAAFNEANAVADSVHRRLGRFKETWR